MSYFYYNVIIFSKGLFCLKKILLFCEQFWLFFQNVQNMYCLFFLNYFLYLATVMCALMHFLKFNFKTQVSKGQGPGTEKFFEAPAAAPLLFNKLWLRLRSSSRFASAILLSSLRF